MKGYKHLPTGRIFEQRGLNDDTLDDFVEVGNPQHSIAHYMVQGKDWEEIKEEKKGKVILWYDGEDVLKHALFQCDSTWKPFEVELKNGQRLRVGDKLIVVNTDLHKGVRHWCSLGQKMLLTRIRIGSYWDSSKKELIFQFHDLYEYPEGVVIDSFKLLPKKEVLFITEDMVEIHTGDKYWRINRYWEVEEKTAKQAFKSELKMFGSKENAERYIFSHKLTLSYNEVCFVLTSYKSTTNALAELKRIITGKLVQ